jgi:predicted PurR-regulated permease PerM
VAHVLGLSQVLGLLAFFMEFVPFAGALVSGIACTAVALTHGWMLALVVIGYFAIVHIIEGDIVGHASWAKPWAFTPRRR